MEWKRTLTDAQKARLTELARWQRYSFPNGISYQSQFLADGDYGDVSMQLVYNCGVYCTFKDEPGVTRIVSFDRYRVGPERDHALTALADM